MILTKLMHTLALTAAALAPSIANADCDDLLFKAEVGNGRWSRVAEDVRLPAGNGGAYRLTTLSASIATNAPGAFEVWFDVFRTSASGGPGVKLMSMRAQSVVTTSVPIFVTVGGVQHRKFFAAMTMPSNMALQLNPGETIFVSPFVRAAFTNGTSAFLLRGDSRAASPGFTFTQNTPTAPWIAPTTADCDMVVSSSFKQFCPADVNKSGGSPNSTDFSQFFTAYTLRLPAADFNGDRSVNNADLAAFLAAYHTPCTMQTPTF